MHTHSCTDFGVVYSDQQILMETVYQTDFLGLDLVLHGDFLYFAQLTISIPSLGEVHRINKTDSAHQEIVIGNLNRNVAGIQVYHRNRATLSEYCSERLEVWWCIITSAAVKKMAE